MKRGMKILIVVLALAIGMSLTACRPGTFTSGNGTTGYSTDFEGFSGNVATSDTYGERYAVKSADLNAAAEGTPAENAAAVVDDVYESYVTIEAGVTGGLQLGSGIIVDIDVEYENSGVDTSNFVYILTCHHVIEESNRIAVYIPKCLDEAKDQYDYYAYGFGATLMGSDKKSDIAVLRIDVEGYEGFTADDVVKAEICNDNLQIGDDIFLLGNPLGTHPGSFSAGKVSRALVEVSVEDIGTMTLTQTDAAANHGNSGGGAYNYAGQLVGILNSGLSVDSDGEPVQGLGFFIPVTGESGVEKIAASLISTVTDDYNGYVEGRWMLGATLQSVRAGGGLFGGGQEYIQVSAIATDNDTYSLSTCGIANGDYLFGMSYEYNGETYTFDEGTLSEFSSFFEEMQQRLTVGDTVQVTYGKALRGAEETGTMTVKQYIYSVA